MGVMRRIFCLISIQMFSVVLAIVIVVLLLLLLRRENFWICPGCDVTETRAPMLNPFFYPYSATSCVNTLRIKHPSIPDHAPPE